MQKYVECLIFLHMGVVTKSIVLYYIRSAGMVTMHFVKKTSDVMIIMTIFLPLIQGQFGQYPYAI